MSKIVSIVGKPNVGKSTLFNRLLQRREAIVSSISGVTRDRNYGKSEWNGVEFSIIDTGGYLDNSDDIFDQKIKKQVQLAIDESSVVLFLVDGQEGITDMDHEVTHLLRKINQPVFLVINKVDNPKIGANAIDFYELGYEKIYCISSISGSGTGDLLDDVITAVLLSNNKDNEQCIDVFENLPKIAITGRPNVGKSTLTNVLLGEERSIVTNISGTTRDSIKSLYKHFGNEFILVDTAGIRKKNKVSEDLEFYSVMRSIRSIEYSDVIIIIIDATIGWESQDMNIFSLVQKNKKGVIIIVNKWDLIQKTTNTMKCFEQRIKTKIAPFIDVPIIFISALNKQKILNVVETAIQVYQNRSKRIKTGKLNEKMLRVIKKYPPPVVKGKYVKIKYCVQLHTHYPQFIFFCNFPNSIKESYKRYIENQLRNEFDFTGVSIEMYFRKK